MLMLVELNCILISIVVMLQNGRLISPGADPVENLRSTNGMFVSGLKFFLTTPFFLLGMLATAI